MDSLLARYRRVRAHTDALVEGLSAEDCQLQSMPDASPLKWHLAHTSWFFETFVLEQALPGYRPFDPSFRVLFNSYYVGVGARHPRPQRGLLSRPSLEQVKSYRRAIDEHMMRWLERDDPAPHWLALVELGLQHEQQHQELILTDLKHHFGCNPLASAWRPRPPLAVSAPCAAEAVEVEGGLVEIGHGGPTFAFDNELPRHRVWLEPFRLASRLVTNAEYQAFIDDGGYRRPELWLAEGWDVCQREDWQAPLYWRADGTLYSLHGITQRLPHEPLCHVSYYEADAYARWAGARLPSEAEWEWVVGSRQPVPGTLLTDAMHCHPQPARENGLAQMLGDCWEWTGSAYLPYPGFRPAEGAVGEYNGKFMINQMVLRGGSCATPLEHIRATYRNFFPAHARWQFSGIRLAWSS